MFSLVFDVEGEPEDSLSSTEHRPALRRLYHSRVRVLLMASSSNACFSISEVSEIVFLNLKLNLTQTRC